MTHESRLHRLLRQLLWGRRTAALATLQTLPGAESVPFTTPAVSFVPYAIDSTAQVLVLHVSALAAHTRNLRQSPAVSLLITAPEDAAQPVHALERVARVWRGAGFICRGAEGAAHVLTLGRSAPPAVGSQGPFRPDERWRPLARCPGRPHGSLPGPVW